MAAPSLRSVVVLTAATMVVILLAGLQSANAEATLDALNLRDCDPDNNGYYPTPSPSNCPIILTVIPKGATVNIICRYPGGDVNGDSWWLYVQYGDFKYGFVSDFYVDCGGPCQYPFCSNPM